MYFQLPDASRGIIIHTEIYFFVTAHHARLSAS